MFKLWPFAGGIRLEPHKEESSFVPLDMAALPKELVYPLTLSDGNKTKSLVSPGERVLKGQMLTAADEMNPPSHAATSGQVKAIESRLLPHPSGMFGDCVVIEVDGKDESIEFQAIADHQALTPDALRERIHAAGIVGLGGAAFPTAVKTNSHGRFIDTLILNAAECEPYISCDDSLLRNFPYRVLAGAKILMHILGASRCLVGVEDDRLEAIAALEQAKSQGGYQNIQIAAVPAIYPIGGEKQLIHVLTGREVPCQGIPADVGVLCQNVATVAAVYQAICTGEPLLSRIVTVTGLGVAQPRNLLAHIGTPIAELIGQCGGYTDVAQRLIIGGPMMGFSLPSDNMPITKSTNCVFVAGLGELTVGKSAMPCIRCGECAAVCPINLLPQQLYWHIYSGNLARTMEYHVSDCIECGCCDYACPSQIPLTQYFQSAKNQLAAKAQERHKADYARERFEARQVRKEKERQEKAETIRRKKELLEKPRSPISH